MTLCLLLTQSGRERGAFAAMQDPDLLYSIRDPFPWGKAHEAARFHLPSGEEIRKMLDHDRQEAKSDLETSVRALRIEIAALETTLTELRSLVASERARVVDLPGSPLRPRSH